MSRIYSNLLQLEMDKQERLNAEPPPRIFEEKVNPGEEARAAPSSEERLEALVELKEKWYGSGQNGRSLPSLFVELATHIKTTLGSIRTFTEFSQGRFKDQEFGNHFQKMVTEDIDRSEAELNCFLDYLKIRSPVPKANTIHLLLEELLRKNEKRLQDKKIKISKKQYEKDLPETMVHEEELRYILNWVLQYALTSVVPNGTIGFLTRSVENGEGKEDLKAPGSKERRYVEILIGFEGVEKPNDLARAALGLQAFHREAGNSFILPLVDEIVQKNHGIMKFRGDGEKRITQVSLVLPVERRRVVYYQSAVA